MRDKFENEIKNLNNLIVSGNRSINFRDVNGISLLAYAIKSNDLEGVKKLIEGGADINLLATDSTSALGVALEAGNLGIAQYLFDLGANCTDIPLSQAKGECYAWFHSKIEEAIKESYPKGIGEGKVLAEVESRFFKRFYHCTITPLERFIEIGQKDVLDVDFAYYYKPTSRRPLSYNDPPRSVGLRKKLLKIAIENGDLAIMDDLLNEAIEDEGSFALIQAVSSEQYNLIDALLVRGADINNSKNSMGVSPLMIAVGKGDPDLVAYLLKNRAQVNSELDCQGNTVFHKAIVAGNYDVLRKLFDSIPDKDKLSEILNIPNIYGQTALDLAFQSKNEEVRGLFAEFKSDKTLTPVFSNIAQYFVLKKMSYYLRLNNRDRVIDEGGCCNGLSVLFGFYAAQGKKDYFEATLGLIADWDGTKEALYRDFPQDFPQKKYYKNLSELLEQWINDVSWFQDPKRVGLKNSQEIEIGKYDIDSQYNLVKGEDINISEVNLCGSSKGATYKEIKTHLSSFYDMKTGTVAYFRGGLHATVAIRTENGFLYYDPNLKRSVEVEDVGELLKIIKEVKYKALSLAPDELFGFDVQFCRFEYDPLKDLKDYIKLISEEEKKGKGFGFFFTKTEKKKAAEHLLAILEGNLVEEEYNSQYTKALMDGRLWDCIKNYKLPPRVQESIDKTKEETENAEKVGEAFRWRKL